MKASYDSSVEGHKLVKVVFERQTPDAAAPTIEVVYHLTFSGDFRIVDNVPVLSLLSCTRTDTREKVTLRNDEQEQVLKAAAEAATEATSIDW